MDLPIVSVTKDNICEVIAASFSIGLLIMAMAGIDVFGVWLPPIITAIGLFLFMVLVWGLCDRFRCRVIFGHSNSN